MTRIKGHQLGFRVGTWNVGSLSGRSGELVQALERRKLKVCCFQRTRWKGEGAKMLRTASGAKYKLFWKGNKQGLNGCGCVISEELIDKVIEVERVSDRLMMVRLLVGKGLVNVISAYAPQVGRRQVEKDVFWESMWDLMERVKDSEMVVLGGDFNGHVGRDSDGYEGVHGGYGYGVRNSEGESILEFCVAADMALCGTQFRKDDNKLISYSSGGSKTTVDYLMVRKREGSGRKSFPRRGGSKST